MYIDREAKANPYRVRVENYYITTIQNIPSAIRESVDIFFSQLFDCFAAKHKLYSTITIVPLVSSYVNLLASGNGVTSVSM